MDWKSTLKLASGGTALFALGALATSVAIGRVPVSVGVWANRAQIEQVVQEYLLAHPDIIIQMSNRLDAQQAAAEQKARDDAPFAVAEIALAVFSEDVVDALAGGLLDFLIRIAERHIKYRGEPFSDRRLSGAHQADQKDILGKYAFLGRRQHFRILCTSGRTGKRPSHAGQSRKEKGRGFFPRPFPIEV
jgi:hypothetical protein